MELLQLMYFKAVAETGKIIAAAEGLHISPPALSASISRLEKELGWKLFDRSNNRITLNRQGEILLRYTNQILSELDNAKYEMQRSLHEREPHIHVAMTTSNIWIELLASFSQEYPHITLSTTTAKLSQIPQGGLSPRYSFLLAEEGDPENTEYESVPLIANDQPVLTVPPAHPLAGRAAVDLKKIKDETFLLPVEDTSLHRMVQSLLTLAGIATGNLHEYSYMMRRKMVASGRGVSFSTVYTSRGEDPNLCYIPIKTPVCRQTHRLFWDKGRELTREESLFRDFAAEFFRVEGG